MPQLGHRTPPQSTSERASEAVGKYQNRSVGGFVRVHNSPVSYQRNWFLYCGKWRCCDARKFLIAEDEFSHCGKHEKDN
jgi:hypothetical protein